MKASNLFRGRVAAPFRIAALTVTPMASLLGAALFGPVHAEALLKAPVFPDSVIAPPISAQTAKNFSENPQAFARFVSQLPMRPDESRVAGGHAFTTQAGGTWHKVTHGAAGLCNPLLLTDATVIVAVCDSPTWYKLTPDINGSYETGTWSQIASLPVTNNVKYAPQYHASGVLPDGRVIIMGGEYNGSNKEVWTNSGAIYDPVANTWTNVYAPPGTSWGMIGDAQSVMLADGKFMLASCCAYFPPVDATFNPKTLGWTGTGAPRLGGNYQDEQGYELLPDGGVLTVDVWTGYPNFNPTNAERYNAAKGTWSPTGALPVSLVDPIVCGNFEIGPAVLRGDGTVVGFGGNTGCVSGASADPTAIFDSVKNTWTQGPNVPAVCGKDGATDCDLADAPAALLPDGNILFAASAGYGGMPTHFFEYSPSNTITQVSDTKKFADTSGAYYYNFLVLPSGQVLSTDFSSLAELYTPAGAPLSNLAPIVYSSPATVAAGKTYQIVGAQLSGRSQGAYYGDDAQMPTNFPIVRITNVATGHVFYARTSGFSTMSVAPKALGSTNFSVPSGVEKGASYLFVVANGIASKPALVTVQ
jgi:hypothetical protein